MRQENRTGSGELALGRSHPISRRTWLLVISLAAMELALFLGLCGLERESFIALVTAPDTGSYVKVAMGLKMDGVVPLEATRPPGYPLFLLVCLMVGGQAYAFHVAIAAQLALNLAFVLLFTRFLDRLAPMAKPATRTTLSLLFAMASTGLALLVLTDFLSAFFFGVFLYGLLFKRSWPWVLIAGCSLAYATLTRSSWIWFPVVLPVFVAVVRKSVSRIPTSHVGAYMLLSLCAVGICNFQTYRSRSITGSDSFFTWYMRRSLYVNLFRDRMSDDEHRNKFEQEIAGRSGRSYQELTRAEKDRLTRDVCLAQIAGNPGRFFRSVTRTFLKLLFVPIEMIVVFAFDWAGASEQYGWPVRLVLFALCLPAWLLALFPPLGAANRSQLRMYFGMILLVAYVLGISSLDTGGGERMRFPILILMLPLAAVNLHSTIPGLMPKLRRRKGASALGRGSPLTGSPARPPVDAHDELS